MELRKLDDVLFYNRLNYLLWLNGFGFTLLNNFTSSERLDVKILLASTSITSYFASCAVPIIQNGVYKKNVKELNQLYQEFIRNYRKFNDQFGYENPYQIYQLYEYMLNNGFLSYNKRMDFQNSPSEISSQLLGARILCGTGVCRNFSAMLNDIFHSKGYCSLNMPIRSVDYRLNDFLKETLERLIEFSGSGAVDLDFNVENIEIDDSANHALVTCIYENRTYFLDPTIKNAHFLDGDFLGSVKFTETDEYRFYDGIRSVLNTDEQIKIYEAKRRLLELKKESALVIPCESKIIIDEDECKKFEAENKELKTEINDSYQKVLNRKNKLRRAYL